MNKPIRFLTLTEVKRIHKRGLLLFSGRLGIRDEHLLRSALGAPQNDHGYGQKSLRHLAASYAFHLTNNHPFFDGNKRTAAGAALIFLRLNGDLSILDSPMFETLMLEASGGGMTKDDFIKHFLQLFPSDLFLGDNFS